MKATRRDQLGFGNERTPGGALALLRRLGSHFTLVIPCMALLVLFGSSSFCRSANPVVIKFSSWGEQQEVAINQKLVELFNKRNPDIKVEFVYIPGGEYPQKIQVMMAGGVAPDVMFMNTAWASSLYQAGALENLTPYFERDPRFSGNRRQDYLLFRLPSLDNISFLFKSGDAMYMLPTRYNTFGTFYNVGAFEESGLQLPGDDFTWDKLLEAARKLTRVEGQNIARGGIQDVWVGWIPFAQAWVTTNNGRLFDSFNHPSRATLTEPETVETFQFLQDLIFKHKVVGGGAFEAGKSAMRFGGFWDVELLRRKVGFDWGIAPWPYAKKPTTVVIIAGFSIWAQSKHKDAAWKFASWLLSPEALEVAHTQVALWNPDLVEQADPRSYYYRLSGLPKNYYYRVGLRNVVPDELTGPYAYEVQNVKWGGLVDPILRGESVATVLAKAEAEINAILFQKGKPR